MRRADSGYGDGQLALPADHVDLGSPQPASNPPGVMILASGKRLVLEDFHYLDEKAQREFAFLLKALGEYGMFVLVIGVWPTSTGGSKTSTSPGRTSN
jgi:hypothetical protein